MSGPKKDEDFKPGEEAYYYGEGNRDTRDIFRVEIEKNVLRKDYLTCEYTILEVIQQDERNPPCQAGQYFTVFKPLTTARNTWRLRERLLHEHHATNTGSDISSKFE